MSYLKTEGDERIQQKNYLSLKLTDKESEDMIFASKWNFNQMKMQSPIKRKLLTPENCEILTLNNLIALLVFSLNKLIKNFRNVEFQQHW